MSSDGFELLERLSSVVDELADFDPDDLDDGEFVEWLRLLESLRRRLGALDLRLIPEVEWRDLPDSRLARSAARFLAQVWRVSVREARARVAQARVLSERVALTGEVLAPVRPVVAASRRRGEIGAEAVRVMTRALDALPSSLPVEEIEGYEQILVDAGQSLGPEDLGKVAERLVATANPDGTLADDTDQERRRHLTFVTERDGMVSVRGLLDAETGARALAVFGALGKPRPGGRGRT